MLVPVEGDLSESDLLRLSYQVRDDLLNLPGVSKVDFSGNRDREISIETDPSALEGYGLSIQDLSDSVRRSSIDLPGGAIRTAGGRLLLRTKSQAYTADDFRAIILRADNGAQVTLGDVARVDDGFTPSRVIEQFHIPFKMAHIVLVNGHFVNPEDRSSRALLEGDVIAIWPPVAGG